MVGLFQERLIAMMMGFFALLIFGLVTLLAVMAGILLILRSGGGGKGYPGCGHSGYDVTGSIGTANRCPECGRSFAEVGISAASAPPRRARMWIGIALLLAPLALLGLVGISLMQAQAAMRTRQAAAATQMKALAAQNQQMMRFTEKVNGLLARANPQQKVHIDQIMLRVPPFTTPEQQEQYLRQMEMILNATTPADSSSAAAEATRPNGGNSP